MLKELESSFPHPEQDEMNQDLRIEIPGFRIVHPMIQLRIRGHHEAVTPGCLDRIREIPTHLVRPETHAFFDFIPRLRPTMITVIEDDQIIHAPPGGMRNGREITEQQQKEKKKKEDGMGNRDEQNKSTHESIRQR